MRESHASMVLQIIADCFIPKPVRLARPQVVMTILFQQWNIMRDYFHLQFDWQCSKLFLDVHFTAPQENGPVIDKHPSSTNNVLSNMRELKERGHLPSFGLGPRNSKSNIF